MRPARRRGREAQGGATWVSEDAFYRFDAGQRPLVQGGQHGAMATKPRLTYDVGARKYGTLYPTGAEATHLSGTIRRGDARPGGPNG